MNLVLTRLALNVVDMRPVGSHGEMALIRIAQEQETENRTGVFRRFETRIRPELIRHTPKPALDFDDFRRHVAPPKPPQYAMSL